MRTLHDLQPQIQARPFNGQYIQEVLGEIGIYRQCTVEDTEFYISQPLHASFRANNFFLAVVEQNGMCVLRTFFLSRSQGVWRMLRAYKYTTDESDTEKPYWNDKGYDEQSLLLPMAIQQELFLADTEAESVSRDDAMLLFYGTVDESGQKDWYAEYVDASPLQLPFVTYTPKGEKAPPHELAHTQDLQFHVLSRWQAENSLYGGCTYFHLNEQKSGYAYLFVRTADQRAWIAGIDNTSPITPIGLREQWVNGGDLVTPAFEYYTERTDHTGGYANTALQRGNYADMYKHFLQHVPLIQHLETVTA